MGMFFSKYHMCNVNGPRRLTNVYTNSYLSHRTVLYVSHSSGVARRIHTVIPAPSRTATRV